MSSNDPGFEVDAQAPVFQMPVGADTRPVSWWSAAKANLRLNLDDDEGGNHLNLLHGYGALEDALVAGGYPRSRYHADDFREPIKIPFPGLDQSREGDPAYGDRMWADVEDARRRNPRAFANFPATRKEFETWAYGRMGARAKDQATAEQGGFGSAIVPGLAFGLANMGDPQNLAQLPLGGGATTWQGFLAKQFAAGVLGQALQTPMVARSRINMGEGYSDVEMGRDLLMAGAVNTAFAGGLTYGPQALAKAGGAVLDRIDPTRSDRQLANAFRQSLKGDWEMSPQQAAALHILERSADVAEANPYHQTYSAIDAHANRIQSVLDQLEAMPRGATPDLAPALGPAVRSAAPGFEQAWGAIIGIEGGTNRDGTFRTSPAGAIGPAQLMPATAEQAARLAGVAFDPVRLRSDHAYNVELGQAYYRELLRQFDGDADKAAAAYNAGPGSAKKGTGVRGAMAKAAAAGNPDDWVKFLPAETQAYVANFRARTGGGASIDVPDTIDPLLVRPAALDAVRPQLIAGDREIPIASFLPAEIGVDAKLMQFKSGGDAQGVTERLRGVEQWDPMSAGMVTVWEANDGRRLIADGHQRLGLANRIAAADPSQDIRLNAFVLREADGFSAADARTLTALKNVREGSGSAADAAKVFREVGLDPELLKSLPPRSALIRDGKALASLSDEAFGAVINDVIPEGYGAAIGALAPDPATHMALVDLLAKTDPPNRKQAEAIVRQAMDAGFHAETQEELFGTRNLVSSIFAQKARLLDKTLGELRKLKGAFGVAARNAEALDSAGNKIDVSASAAAAAANANAIGLVDALALRKGNAVSDLFNRAAQRLTEGEPLAAVTRDVVAELRQLDLEAALRDAGEPGGQPGGSGRANLADDEAQAGEGEPGNLSPADRDELEAAGQGGFAWFDQEAHQTFDDPTGQGLEEVAQSVWHDVRAQVLFHGTPAEHIAAFDIAMAGQTDIGNYGRGIYFTPDQDEALHYKPPGRGSLISAKVDLRKPFHWDQSSGAGEAETIANLKKILGADADRFLAGSSLVRSDEAVSAVTDALIRAGYDGVEALTPRGSREVVAFDPASISIDNVKGENPTANPAIADRQRQEAQLAAQSPLRAKSEQDGTMGSPLFDAADQPKFDLGDGKGERTIAEIEAELDADQAAVDAIKGCLL